MVDLNVREKCDYFASIYQGICGLQRTKRYVITSKRIKPAVKTVFHLLLSFFTLYGLVPVTLPVIIVNAFVLISIELKNCFYMKHIPASTGSGYSYSSVQGKLCLYTRYNTFCM